MPRCGPDRIVRAGTAAALLVAVAACATVPAPPPPGATAFAAIRYRCENGTAFTARFDQAADTATLVFDADVRLTLPGRQPASGIWYESGGWSLRGRGGSATLGRPDGRVAACRSGPVRDAPPVQSPRDRI